MLIPLLTLEESVLIARNADEFLDIAEQDAARQQIEAYFCSGNPIEINGAEAVPAVERCDFYGLDFKDFARQAPPKRVPMVSARVGIILRYEIDTPPRTVKVTWNRFSNSVWSVNTTVFAYDETSSTTLSRLGKRNVFTWESRGRREPMPIEPVAAVLPPTPAISLPVLSLCCLVVAGAVAVKLRGASPRFRLLAFSCPLLIAALTWSMPRWEVPCPLAPRYEVSGEQADSIFVALHRNIYGAFRFREESVLYDALAVSVHGELLREIYLEIRRGLVMQEQGGAVCRVHDIEILDGQHEPIAASEAGRMYDKRGFAYRCRWNVSGTVEHWGHIHERTGQYEAIFDVEPVDGAWRMTRMQILNERRVQFETRLRGS
jgi:hypothetical protein